MSALAEPVGTFESEVAFDVTSAPQTEEPDTYDVVISLFGGLELFHTSDGSAFATFDVGGRRRTMRISSNALKKLIMHRYREATKKMISPGELKKVTEQLEAEACTAGPRHEIHRRVARHGEALLVDLADGTGRVIRITELGWDVTHVPEVRFIDDGDRASPLPEPVRGGSIQELRPFVNVASGDAFLLLVGFMLSVFRPAAPFMVLIVNGPQGSSKSTLTRIIRRLIDPGKPEIRQLGDKPEDILIGARFSRLLAFDNLSGISAKMSDTICSLVTGAGFATRQFFTNLDEVFLEVSASVILNGIDGLSERADLADRAVFIELERISEENRRDEATFWHEFNAAAPRILGAMCDALSSILSALPTTKLARAPRMADSARWMTAAESGLGVDKGTFLRLLDGNRDSALADSGDADSIVLAVHELAKSMKVNTTEFTATSLLRTLDSQRMHAPLDPRWPKTPARLGSRLNRATPALLHRGVEIDRTRGATKQGERLIRITYRPPMTTMPPASAVSAVSNVVPFNRSPLKASDDALDEHLGGPSENLASNSAEAAGSDGSDGVEVSS